MHSIIHAILDFIGVNSGDSSYATHMYNFWSGFGSDLTEFAIIGSLIGIYRHHNCSIKGCPRIAHHNVDGTKFRTCHKHATRANHRRLFTKHKKDFPLQHSLFNDK